MRWWDDLRRAARGLRFRARGLLHGTRERRDLEDEMDFHLERETERWLAAGLSAPEARRRARLAFGATDRVQEEVRTARGTRGIEDVLRDARITVRQLRRHPSFSVTSVVTLALGLAAAVAVVSVVNRVLLAPLPFAESERLTVIWQFDRLTGTQREPASLPDLWDFQERNRTFDGMGAFNLVSRTLTEDDREPQRLEVVIATADLPRVLRVTPLQGRWFTAEEDAPGGPAVALIGQGFWQSELGGRPDVLGEVVVLDDVPYRIIGVVPSAVTFPARAAVWIPLQADETILPRFTHPLTVVGRLGEDATLPAARQDMTRIAAELEAEYTENAGRGAFVEPLTEVLRGTVRPALLALLAASVTLLLIACVNVTGLLLARGAVRSREFAIATALGATKRDLFRRLTIEALVLTGLALVAGFGLAAVALRFMAAAAPPDVASLDPFTVDGTVVLVALGASLLLGLLFGVVPLRHLGGEAPMGTLREQATGGSASHLRLRRVLVAVQVGLAGALLIQAGLLVRSLANLQAVDTGFTERNVLRADYQLPATRYPRDFSVYPEWPEVVGFHSALLTSLTSRTDVEAAAIGTNHPLDRGFTNSFTVVGRSAEESRDQGELSTRIVSAGYFATVGLPVMRGRTFAPEDDAGAPMVLMLNQAAADRYFRDDDPIGQDIAFWGQTREVVGIVANERILGLDQAPPPAMYVPLYQAPPVGATTVMIRTRTDPAQLVQPLRQTIQDLDADLALYNISTMHATVRAAAARWRFTSMLLTAFAGVALTLAAIGVYGVLSFMVSQRTREIGVRMALGARRGRVLRLIMGQGARLTAAGLVLGVLVGVGASRLLASLLFGVGRGDPLTYLAVVGALAGAALLACWIPAVRASRVDPVRALQSSG